MQNTSNETVYRQQLKGRILQIATALFHQHGIKQVKMDDIANDLRISKRTLYEVYENKEDLLFEVLQQHDSVKRQQLLEFDKPGTNVINIILEIYRVRTAEFFTVNPLFFEDLQKYPNLLTYVRKLHDDKEAEIVAFIERGKNEGLFLENVNYGIVRELTFASEQFVMNNFLFKRYDITELSRIMIMLFVRGICTEKGIKLLDQYFAENA